MCSVEGGSAGAGTTASVSVYCVWVPRVVVGLRCSYSFCPMYTKMIGMDLMLISDSVL